jgi:acylglycerol lipase
MFIVWSAVFLSAPAIVVDPKFAKPYLVAAASVISACFPKKQLPGDKVTPDMGCRDEEFNKKFNEDPVIYKGLIKGRFGYESLKALKIIQEKVIPNWTLPIMVAHGTKDKIVMISGSQMLYDKTVKCTDKKIMIYEGFYHELLQEPLTDRTRVYQDMSSWFAAHAN